jgi:hypothetical protein
MYYTTVSPASAPDRVHLFPDPATALARDAITRQVFAVALRVDAQGHHVVPLLPDPIMDDPRWTTPAELHADGSITVKGPIPEALYILELGLAELSDLDLQTPMSSLSSWLDAPMSD